MWMEVLKIPFRQFAGTSVAMSLHIGGVPASTERPYFGKPSGYI
jgi:hypothetical protein